jgi:hypothetical protein
VARTLQIEDTVHTRVLKMRAGLLPKHVEIGIHTKLLKPRTRIVTAYSTISVRTNE